MRLTFLGAAHNVTGSCTLVESDGARVLVDCGLYQEWALRLRNWDPFPVPPASIDAVLLTHAHLDHCGLLPKLAREGFKGPIYGTAATVDIAGIVLKDSGRIQEEDAAFKKKRHQAAGVTARHPEAPLYTAEEAAQCLKQFVPVRYDEPFRPGGGLEATCREAGHILGSASILLRWGRNGDGRRLLLSGDLGRYGAPILRDPAPAAEADAVVVESTYGNRVHKDNETIPDTLAAIINETRAAGGNVVIPSFAIERAQDLLYHLHLLLRAGRIPRLPVLVDSPMAVHVTEVFRRHPELLDAETVELLRKGEHPCDFPGLTMVRSVEESKGILKIRGTAIIIAGAGMCTGGRIKHHLRNNLGSAANTILFVGYQAAGTLGREILEGAPKVRIFGCDCPVRARVAKVNGFSAHGDRNELFRWLSGIPRPPRQVFVTHGEPEAAAGFADFVRGKTGWNVSVAGYRQVAEL